MFEITGKVLETSKQSYPSLKPDTMMPSLEPITRTKPKAVVPKRKRHCICEATNHSSQAAASGAEFFIDAFNQWDKFQHGEYWAISLADASFGEGVMRILQKHFSTSAGPVMGVVPTATPLRGNSWRKQTVCPHLLSTFLCNFQLDCVMICKPM